MSIWNSYFTCLQGVDLGKNGAHRSSGASVVKFLVLVNGNPISFLNSSSGLRQDDS